MKKQIWVLIFIVASTILVCCGASASELVGELNPQHATVIWYTGLTDNSEPWQQTGASSTSPAGEMWIPNTVRDYRDLNITWELIHESGPDTYELDKDIIQGYTDSNFRVKFKPKSSTLTDGDSIYTVRAIYKGVTYEGTVTVRTTSSASLPTGMIMKAYKRNDDGEIGNEIAITNGELTVKANEPFYVSGTVNGNLPGYSDDMFQINVMNIESESNVRGPWTGGNDTTRGIYQYNTVWFSVSKPGIYQVYFWFNPKETNYTVTMPITFRVTDENGNPPEEPLAIQAGFRESNPKAGQTLHLDWTASGGTAPYNVQVAWQAQESCLQKVMQTDTFTTSSGTASYTLPNTSIDQVEAIVTVTDSTGATQSNRFHTNLEGWDHGHNVGRICSLGG